MVIFNFCFFPLPKFQMTIVKYLIIDFEGSDKDAFVFTLAFQSIPKRTTNQFREFLRKMLPRNLAPVNKQMLAWKLIEKGLQIFY